MERENPPAFPRIGEGFGNPHYDEPGMSLRDWFAGQALAGFAAHHHASQATWLDERVATSCYEVADAMLRARALSTPFTDGEGK